MSLCQQIEIANHFLVGGRVGPPMSPSHAQYWDSIWLELARVTTVSEFMFKSGLLRLEDRASLESSIAPTSSSLQLPGPGGEEFDDDIPLGLTTPAGCGDAHLYCQQISEFRFMLYMLSQLQDSQGRAGRPCLCRAARAALGRRVLESLSVPAHCSRAFSM